jgi:hypothetical protein
MQKKYVFYHLFLAIIHKHNGNGKITTYIPIKNLKYVSNNSNIEVEE